MKEIPINKSTLTFKVDDEDHSKILAHNTRWHLNGKGYVSGWSKILQRNEFVHRLLLPNSSYVHHKDEDKLNNQRNNLEACSNGENMALRGKYSAKFSGTTSKYLGVSLDKRRGKYRGRVLRHRREYAAGYFYTEFEAAIARDALAKKLFGSMISLNYYVT